MHSQSTMLALAECRVVLRRGHGVHVFVPDLYLPMSHAVHCPQSFPMYPSLHLHAVLAVLPAAEAEFARHFEHVYGPNPTLYSLTLHCEHAAPSAPVYPALH